MQLEGRLGVVPLRELIEMIVYSSVTGMLELRCESGVAQLFFRDGQPVHAAAGETQGMDAVSFMFEQIDGDFQFYAGNTPPAETLWSDPIELIDRAEQLAQRWKTVRAHIPSVTYIPVLLNTKSSPVQVGQDLWRILSAIDGKRTIIEIADTLHLDHYDTCISLISLKQRDLIDFTPPPESAGNAAKTGGLKSGKAAKRGSFFERLIERTLEEESRDPNSRYAPPDSRYVESD